MSYWSHQKKCEICGKCFTASRIDAKTCGPTCKKRRQRGSKRTGHGGFGPLIASQVVPFILEAVPVIQRVWPQGTVVRVKHPGTQRVEPGRVDWNSKAGETCLKLAAHLKKESDVNNTYLIPIATLKAVHPFWIWDVVERR